MLGSKDEPNLHAEEWGSEDIACDDNNEFGE
jgi:hypothetical protein